MKTIKRSIIYLFTLPADVFAWLAVLLVWLFFGRNLHIQAGCLATEVKTGSWPLRSFMADYSGITLGHGLLYRQGRAGPIDDKYNPVDTRLERHEHAHVGQFEGAALAGLVLAALATLLAWLGLWYVVPVIWLVAPLVAVLANSAIAWLQSEDPYRGASHEKAARAIAGLTAPIAKAVSALERLKISEVPPEGFEPKPVELPDDVKRAADRVIENHKARPANGPLEGSTAVKDPPIARLRSGDVKCTADRVIENHKTRLEGSTAVKDPPIAIVRFKCAACGAAAAAPHHKHYLTATDVFECGLCGAKNFVRSDFKTTPIEPAVKRKESTDV